MAKMQTQNMLALSVAALVASGVAAFVGVATFNDDLIGKSVYLAQEWCPGGCPAGQWCDYMTHSCKSSDGGMDHENYRTSGGTSGSTSTSTTTSGPVGLNCAGGSLSACQKTCVKDGVTNQFCMGYCAQECPSTSTTTSTSTTVTVVTNRCAYVTEGDGCMAKCTCYVENTASCSSPKAGEAEFCNAVKGADTAKTGKTGAFSMTTCSNYCDELKAAASASPPLAPTVEPAPAVEPAPVATQVAPVETTIHPAASEEFENEEFSSDGDVEDFGDFENFGEPEDFGQEFGPPMDEFGFFEDEFGYMPEEGDFEDYFTGYGSPMGGEFDEGFGGSFGEIPEWEREEMLHIAENFCPGFVDRIKDAETPEELFDKIGIDMQMECGGGDMGGPQSPEEGLAMMQKMPEAIDAGLTVLEENGFDEDVAGNIREILVQVSAAAKDAEEACADVDFGGGEFGEDFGAQLLAQRDEEGDDEGSDDMGGDADAGACMETMQQAFSFMDDPEDPENPDTVRGVIQPAAEGFFRVLHGKDPAKSEKVFGEFMRAMDPIVNEGGEKIDEEQMTKIYAAFVKSDFDFDASVPGGGSGEDFQGDNFEEEDLGF